MSTADVRRELLGIAAEAPPNPYVYPRTYVVRNGRVDGRLDLDPPADMRDVLPTLAGVAWWGPPGMSTQALPGDRVLVVFRDARQERPVVVGFEPLSTGRHPRVSLDADVINLGSAAGPAARVGDLYSVGTAAGPLTYLGPGTTDPLQTRVKV